MQRAGVVASSSAGRSALPTASCQCLPTQRRWASAATAIRNQLRSKMPYDPITSKRSTLLQRENRSTPLGVFNGRLFKAVEAQSIKDAFDVCAKMKEQNVRPDVETYNSLLKVLNSNAQHDTMYAVFDDMNAAGVAPNLETYNLMITSARFNDLNPHFILDRMAAAGVERNASTYHNLIAIHVDRTNLEMCLRLMEDMRAHGIQPALATAQDVIKLATKLDNARLALDVALEYEESSIRRLPVASWMQILQCSASMHYLEGVEHCWQKGVVDGAAAPDEGLCLEVLHVAARAGNSALATEAIRALKTTGVPIREHHLAPVLEAFIAARELKDAFSVLSLMRANNIAPNEETTEPIFQYIVGSVEEVDKAFYVVEDLHNEGKPIDVSAINAIIRASAELNDLQRVVGTYKECERLGVTPIRATYHYLLDACVKAKHRALGEKLLAEMKAAGFKPDPMTLEHMIMLSLTQPSYEEAFYYLEELKEKTQDVPARVYEAIIRKCVVSFDPRWKVAAEEMQQRKYTLSPNLLKFIERGDDSEGPGERDAPWVPDPVGARQANAQPF